MIEDGSLHIYAHARTQYFFLITRYTAQGPRNMGDPSHHSLAGTLIKTGTKSRLNWQYQGYPPKLNNKTAKKKKKKHTQSERDKERKEGC